MEQEQKLKQNDRSHHGAKIVRYRHEYEKIVPVSQMLAENNTRKTIFVYTLV